MKSFRYLTKLFIATFIIAPAIRGDIIFSSIASDNLPAGSGAIVLGGPSTSNSMIAEPFAPLQDFLLDGASVAVDRVAGTGPLNIALWSDLNGKPDVPLETAVVPSGSVSRNTTIVSVRFSFGTRLRAHTRYWLVLSAAPGTEYGWASSLVSPPWYGKRNNEAWKGYGCPGHRFDVTGQRVP
jgi:hypothetical protein